MKEYPKIPRYDHPVVEKTWFGKDAFVIEKYDGSNFRFALYDKYYREYENIDVATNGDFILGSSTTYRPESDTDEFSNNLKFKSRLEYIKQKVDTKELRQLHERYESPVVFFAENMIRHTLEYDWDSIDPLIIFDAYVPGNDTEDNSVDRIYKEKFTGFTDWNTLTSISNNVLNMRMARHIQTGMNYECLSPDIIGESEYSTQRAEGWVIRNDSQSRRVKIRTPEFKELNRQIWGGETGDDEPEAKRIAYGFATSTRIKKEFEKVIKEEGYKITKDMMEYLTVKVVEDIWEEEWEEFYNRSFVPYDIYRYVAERIKGTLLRPNMFGFPNETENTAKSWVFDERYTPDSISPHSSGEYIRSLITDDVLLVSTKKIVGNSDREFGNWVIPELTNRIRYYIWYKKREDILRVSKEIDGGSVNESLYDITVPFVKKRDNGI